MTPKKVSKKAVPQNGSGDQDRSPAGDEEARPLVWLTEPERVNERKFSGKVKQVAVGLRVMVPIEGVLMAESRRLGSQRAVVLAALEEVDLIKVKPVALFGSGNLGRAKSILVPEATMEKLKAAAAHYEGLGARLSINALVNTALAHYLGKRKLIALK